MGKRELLIILAFLTAGAGVYQLTVVRRDTDRSFSFATALDNLRPRSRRERATAVATYSGVIPAPAGVAELKVAGLTTAFLIGEDRVDIGYDIAIEASGRDEEAARTIAQSAAVVTDLAGSVLAITVRSSPGGRPPSTTGTLRIPRQWRVTIEGSSTADLTHLSDVHLHRMTGEARLRDIRGTITGSHRNGKLIVDDVDRIDVLLVQSQAEIANVREELRLAFRGGAAKVTSVKGPVTIDGDDYDLVLVEPGAPVHLTGADAELRIERPRSLVRAELRRSTIAIELDRATPLVLSTTEDPLEVQLDDNLPVTINARTTGEGVIDASALGLSPEKRERESSLSHRIGSDAEIVLRNQRDDIVIAKRKW